MAARKPKSRGQSSHGGKRPGAGRKSTAARKLRAELLAEADREIIDNLPKLIGNMLKLANGGYKRVEEKFEPDTIVTVDPDGRPTTNADLVLIERKVTIAEPDRAANIYLLDRILGRPKQAVEVSGKDGGPMQVTFYIPTNGRDSTEADPPQLDTSGDLPVDPG